MAEIYPLSSDVVRLVRKHARHVGIAGRRCKENSKVSSTDIVREAEEW